MKGIYFLEHDELQQTYNVFDKNSPHQSLHTIFLLHLQRSIHLHSVVMSCIVILRFMILWLRPSAVVIVIFCITHEDSSICKKSSQCVSKIHLCNLNVKQFTKCFGGTVQFF